MPRTEYFLLGKKVTEEEFVYFKAELTISETPVSQNEKRKVFYAADPDGRQFEYREIQNPGFLKIELERMPEENY